MAGLIVATLFEDTSRRLLLNTPITLYNTGTSVLATVWLDAAGTLAAPNPRTTDAYGNLPATYADAETVDAAVNGGRVTLAVNLPALVLNGSVTPAKLSFDPATQAELDAAVAGAPGRELRYADNVSGAVNAAATTNVAVDIPGCTFSVLPSARPVWLMAGAQMYQTVLGTAQAWLSIYEIIAGVSTLKYSSVQGCPNVAANDFLPQHFVRRRIGAVTAERTFKLAFRIVHLTGTPAISVTNSDAYPSYLKAVTG